jgi:hypothetical protein
MWEEVERRRYIAQGNRNCLQAFMSALRDEYFPE